MLTGNTQRTGIYYTLCWKHKFGIPKNTVEG